MPAAFVVLLDSCLTSNVRPDAGAGPELMTIEEILEPQASPMGAAWILRVGGTKCDVRGEPATIRSG